MAGIFLAVKALRRPVLLGLGVSVLLLLIFLATSVESRLVYKYYSYEVMANILLSQTLAAFVLEPLQTLSFVVLTIVLFRRRLRLSSAS